jgi:hypothetical protein
MASIMAHRSQGLHGAGYTPAMIALRGGQLGAQKIN